MKRTLLTIALFAISSLTSFAQTAEQLKEQMAARLPEITAMKDLVLIGENNQAYLSILGNVSEAQAVVIQEENSDRRVVYTMLAKQTGASVEKIQTRRAEQIRERATPGTKVQTPNGEWITK